MTAEDLLQLAHQGARLELVRGSLVAREPAGFRHGATAMRLALHLGNFVSDHQLGVVVAVETGFTVSRNPDTVRAPDVAFIARARIPYPEPRGFAELAPDLVVEITSPDDRPAAVAGKVGNWLQAGSRLVWVIDPQRREARVHRADGSATTVTENEVLDGEDVLPGLRISLGDVLG
ncbi:MAG: Uma2 family endonuclease [Gemmatimonadaceae bacterium]|nr:Uma2 family endonuclease [Gemmatimonadaceae bacterium]